MKPTRRFIVTSNSELDFPAVRSGRLKMRLFKLGQPDTEIFLCALDSGFIAATPKVGAIHITYLASDRDEVSLSVVPHDHRCVWATVRFYASDLLDADDHEIQWRCLKAGLLGLRAISEEKTRSVAVVSFIRSACSSIPSSLFPPYQHPTEEQNRLFYEHALFSRGRKSGRLTVELSGDLRDFQPIFDRLTSLLANANLGEWQGDSGNDIEFRSKNLSAAKALVESHLNETFDGTFRFTTLPD